MTASNFVKFAVVSLFVSCNLFCAISGYSKGATAIDAVRAQYLQFEAELWSIIENGVDQSSVLNQILGQHKAFIDRNITQNDIDENEFFLFEKIYEWSAVKDSLMPIRSLFDSFAVVVDKNVDHFNNVELIDLADTVISEVEQLNSTAESIENLMVKQGTYYKVMLVRIWRFHCILCSISSFDYILITTEQHINSGTIITGSNVIFHSRKLKTWFAFRNNQRSKCCSKCTMLSQLPSSRDTL